MDRLAELSNQLNAILAELHGEALRHDLPQLNPALSWLDESNSWLKYELTRLNSLDRDPVPFTYIPIELRK